MIIHTPEVDDEVIPTMSPAVYFGTGWVVIFVVVVELWLEQPARSTHRIIIRPSRSP